MVLNEKVESVWLGHQIKGPMITHRPSRFCNRDDVATSLDYYPHAERINKNTWNSALVFLSIYLNNILINSMVSSSKHSKDFKDHIWSQDAHF